MILTTAEFPSLKKDIDLSKIENSLLYCKKVHALAVNGIPKLKKDALKIHEILKEYFPHYYI